MKCEIIRDLMPMYLDGLTSEESNQAIREHLDGCASCKKMLEQMKQETEVKTEEVKKKINPFRKVNRKIKIYVAATLVICIAFGGVFWSAFVKGWAVEPEDITIDVSIGEENLWLDFTLQEDAVLQTATMYDQTTAEISLRRVYQMPFDDRGKHPNQFSWGIDVNTDEKTEQEYAVTIDYGNKTETYTLAELLQMAK